MIDPEQIASAATAAGTISATLATLVGLLSSFKQERGAQEALSHRQFSEWLQGHHFEQLAAQIANNHHLQTELDGLLREDHQVMIAKLNGIEAMLAGLLSQVNGFGRLAKVLHPGSELSTQAIEILNALVSTGARMLTSLPSQGGRRFFLVYLADGTNRVDMNFDEPRFVEDDLKQLTSLGFLSEGFDGRSPTYQLTRLGGRYVQLLGR